jgi:hypothetical protein
MRFCLRSFALLALVALLSSPTRVSAAQGIGQTVVVATLSGPTTDLVLLDTGYNVGLRAGMVCRVTRGNLSIGDILLVELRPTAASALILSLAPNQAILGGDQITAKILKS